MPRSLHPSHPLVLRHLLTAGPLPSLLVAHWLADDTPTVVAMLDAWLAADPSPASNVCPAGMAFALARQVADHSPHPDRLVSLEPDREPLALQAEALEVAGAAINARLRQDEHGAFLLLREVDRALLRDVILVEVEVLAGFLAPGLAEALERGQEPGQ